MSADDMSFHFFATPVSPGGDRSNAVTEAELLEAVRKKEAELAEALWNLAWFYSQAGRQTDALELIERVLQMTVDPERKAACLLALGQFMEQLKNFPSALDFYSRAFVMEPACNGTWYLINNNLGFCLNTLGRHDEAEPYCRAAIAINPDRQNAYKNLGISLEGQRKCRDAAEAYLAAIRANAADGRALGHLESLYRANPQLAAEIPEFEEKLARCREAVALVRSLRGRTFTLPTTQPPSPTAKPRESGK